VILAVPIKGLKARHVIARGNAPGTGEENHRALKGSNGISANRIGEQICFALTGLERIIGVEPGASPRAIIFRPYRAGEGMVGA